MIKVTLLHGAVAYINPQHIVKIFENKDYVEECSYTYILTVKGSCDAYLESIDNILLQIERGILWVS